MKDKLEYMIKDEFKLKQFRRYYELLTEWNKVMNLTAITEYDEVVEKHFLDSLSIERVVDLAEINNVIDVGTGAGFPGIPLKIAYPHLNVVLLDTLNKRVKFLNTVINELGFSNIEAIHGRAEDAARKEEYREKFDLCVSRAVANLSTLSEYCIPFVKRGGLFISYKSENIDEELQKSTKAIKILGGNIDKVVKFQLENTELRRSFVKIMKINNTSKKYPRKAGLPGKEPL